jgi:hypothetical protein
VYGAQSTHGRGEEIWVMPSKRDALDRGNRVRAMVRELGGDRFDGLAEEYRLDLALASESPRPSEKLERHALESAATHRHAPSLLASAETEILGADTYRSPEISAEMLFTARARSCRGGASLVRNTRGRPCIVTGDSNEPRSSLQDQRIVTFGQDPDDKGRFICWGRRGSRKGLGSSSIPGRRGLRG